MFRMISYTLLTALTVDLLATSGDITLTWSSPMITKLYSNDSDTNPFDRPITKDEESWIGSLINIGAMIGPFPFGYISGRFGRRIGLLCIAIPHIVSYLTFAFAKNIYLYYFGRILGGLAVGGGYSLLPVYMAEIAEDSNRGFISSTLCVFWSFGNLVPYVIGPYTPVLWFNVILACVPTAFFILFFLIGPESPYFLVLNRKEEEAKKSLGKLRSNNKKAIEEEIAYINRELQKNTEASSPLDLFKSKTYIKALIISIILVLAQQLSGIDAVLFYTEQIFKASGATDIEPEISSIIVGLIIFFSSFGTLSVVERLGRKLLILISLFGITVAHAGLGLFFFLKDETDVNVDPISWLPLVSLVLYVIAFNAGMNSLPWTVSSELFPTNVKSYAASLLSCICYTTSFIVTKFYHDSVDAMGEGGTFWMFGGICFLTGIFVIIYLPETKGKSFQEIQDILEKR